MAFVNGYSGSSTADDQHQRDDRGLYNGKADDRPLLNPFVSLGHRQIPGAGPVAARPHRAPPHHWRRCGRQVFESTENKQSGGCDSGKEEDERAPIVEFVEPRSDENARLVSQGGLFTRGPDAVNLDAWVKANFLGVTDYLRLLKITVPNSEREVALRTLNRMNINHLSLFPDLYGASKFANLDLLIDKY